MKDDGDKTIESKFSSLVADAADVLCAAAYVAQEDFNGARQIVTHFGLMRSSHSELIQPPTRQNMWTAAGTIIGRAAEFTLVHKTIGAVLPAEKSISSIQPIFRMAAAGSLTEIIKPVKKDDSTFEAKKLSQAEEGFYSFFVAGATKKYFDSKTIFGREGRRCFADSIAANALSGAAGGAVNAEFSSYYDNDRHINVKDLATGIASGFVFGAAFGVADWKFNKIAISSEHSNVFKIRYPDKNLPASESLAGKDYDLIRPVGTTVLNWLSQNDRRFKFSEHVLAKIAEETTSPFQPLALGAWEPETRVSVLKTLKKFAGPNLSSDHNIDEFISAVLSRSPLVQNKFVAAMTDIRNAEVEWHNAFNELASKAKSLAPGVSFEDLVAGKGARSETPELVDAMKNTLDKERKILSLPFVDQFTDVMNDSMHEFANRMRLPKIRYRWNDWQDNNANYFRNKLTLKPSDVGSGISAESIAMEYHEWSHHEDGSANLANLVRLAKWNLTGTTEVSNFQRVREESYFIKTQLLPKIASGDGKSVLLELSESSSSLSKRVFGKNIPDSILKLRKELIDQDFLDGNQSKILKSVLSERMESLLEKSARAYFSEYVGSRPELKAHSAQLLAYIRARAWGIPPDALPPSVPLKNGPVQPRFLLHLAESEFTLLP